MRLMTKLIALGGMAYGVKWAYDKYVASGGQAGDHGNEEAGRGSPVHIGYDTPTGTDPTAKYSGPGYEDKSFGQAVNEDQELVDRLVDHADGDLDVAENAFRESSAGAPALDRQERPGQR
jgi:hypothetical protein